MATSAAPVRERMRTLIDLVGGAGNVASVTHCLTRLRFVLNDPAVPDIKAIEQLDGVKGCFASGGQFQVVIGNEVEEYHRELVGLLGEGAAASKDDVKAAARAHMKWWERGISHLAEIFVPLLPAIIAGGLILGFRNLIGDVALFGDKPLTDGSTFWQGTYDFLWLIGEAIFHFLPVAVCWSTVRKLGGTPVLGIVLGITLVSPQLMNAYELGAKKPEAWDFGFFTMEKVGYQAQVIPAILAGLALALTERWLKKAVPTVLHQVIVPLGALLVTVFLAHAVLGPVGREAGELVGHAAKAAMTGSFAPVGAMVFGFLYAPLVITGLHHTTNAVDLQLIQDMGGTPIFPLLALSNIAQASAVVGVIIVAKRAKDREIGIPAAISAYLGVTEPALYGVNLKFRWPMLAAMVGSSLAALVCGLGGVLANSIGNGGPLGILSVQPRYWGWFSLAMAVAIAVPILLTVALARRASARAMLGEAETAAPSPTPAAAPAPIPGDGGTASAPDPSPSPAVNAAAAAAAGASTAATAAN
ncbi:PTS trehalose transporter subunit IIBC [Streptomyces sp. NPDC059009]|uniref:PTS trehalose transporter subunit IIBC n=1 Tax=Streptomyces sp. NPDC059009 TaxID=3346694 RepID=UPI0036C9ED87